MLVVCMLDSIHSARWLRQFEDEKIDFLLFPSSPHRRIHSEVEELLAGHNSAKYRLITGGRILSVPLWILDKFSGNFFRGSLLRKVAKDFHPIIVHSLKLQNAGYVSLKALSPWGAKRS